VSGVRESDPAHDGTPPGNPIAEGLDVGSVPGFRAVFGFPAPAPAPVTASMGYILWESLSFVSGMQRFSTAVDCHRRRFCQNMHDSYNINTW
jgi:hypothetical protein